MWTRRKGWQLIQEQPPTLRKEVPKMEYRKPELSVLGDANTLVQSDKSRVLDPPSANPGIEELGFED